MHPVNTDNFDNPLSVHKQGFPILASQLNLFTCTGTVVQLTIINAIVTDSLKCN